MSYMRPDPAKVLAEETERQSKERRALPSGSRTFLWGNGELGALGQLGFRHPRHHSQNIVNSMRQASSAAVVEILLFCICILRITTLARVV